MKIHDKTISLIQTQTMISGTRPAVCCFASLIVLHPAKNMNVASLDQTANSACRLVALSLARVWVFNLLLLGAIANGQVLESVPEQTPLKSEGELDQLITTLVLDSMPHTFSDRKKWGQQAERFDGFKRERDGARFKVSRRKKLVNHGTWQKYDVSLRDPKRKFAISVNSMRELPDNMVGFNIDFTADLNVSGRQSKWVKGVQLYSLSANGHAQIRLRLAMELAVKTDRKTFPPDLLFVPKVTSADVQLEEFRIDRVGKAGGEFSQQLSRRIRPMLEEKIEAKEQGLVDKINKKLLVKQDRLRLPISEVINSKWAKLSKNFLPSSLKDEIE